MTDTAWHKEADNAFEEAVLARLDKLIDLLTPKTTGAEIHYHFPEGTDTRVAGHFATSHPSNNKNIT